MKIAKRPQAYRIRRILEMIRAGKSETRLPSANDFARELEVSWPTIMRDLDYLRDEEGAPIEYNASKKGYFLRDDGWSLKPVTLNQREVFAFSVASRMLHPFRGTPLEMDLSSLFSKIARSLEGSVTLSVDALTDHVSLIGEDYVPMNRDRWVALAGYISGRSAISMRYQKFSGETKRYQVSPVHLAAYHGNWYFIAYGRGKAEPATFALSRIRSIRCLKGGGWAPDNFDASLFMKKAFGITQGEKEMSVHLRFSKNIATYIAERVWHPSQRVVMRKDGSVDFRMVTRGWKELVRWILSWQPDVQVMAPEALRLRVEEKLVLGLARNSNLSQSYPTDLPAC